VLDNCEQVLAGAADVASALLRVVPDVRVLATSREPLRVVSETLLEIPPLGVPDEREERPDELLRSDAVRLFVDRAARAKPGFALDDHNARAVATIARGLDGLPLAIELAAARSNSMTPAQIADRLGRRFDLLTTGPRDVGERHRTLRALVDWSYDLLSDREALAFRRLGVFHGGFTVEAAEAVCGGAPLDELDVLPLLGQLADRSLLVPDERYGQPRYRMLETIRGYAVAKLEESGEAPVLRARHVEWFRDRARRSYEELIGPRQRRWLDELEADMPNLRAVLEATAEGEGRDPDERLDPLVWLGRFWLIRGYIAEGMRWLDSALRQPYGESELVARAKHMYCNLAYMQGDAAAAQAAGWEAVEMARRLDHPEILVLALNSLGNISIRLREFDEARRLLTEALRIARERGEERNMTPVLGNLGLLEMYLGDDDAAEAFMRETLDLARQLDDRELVANQLNNLGVIAWNRDRVEESKALFEEGLAVAREIGAKNAMANFLVNLAEYAEDPDEAEILAGESLEAAQDLGERGVAAGALNALGRAAEAKGEMGRARGFYAEAIHEAERGRAIEWRAVATGNLAKLLLLEDAEAGEGYAREALILRKEIGDTGALGSLVIALVRAAQDAGAADAARRLMEEGLTICRSLDPEMADEVAAEIQAAVRTDRS
ncbi:MAG TPA: tetratricopeptide repeat protein, partial [Actinomycetota bacterium]|nr:tetratricopeptide repeat protein [Actinomycetota bacterium]